MADGSEPTTDAQTTARLDGAVRGLVAVDTKAMIAYVLNAAAVQDLAAGDLSAAERRATAALAAATVVGRRSEIAVSRALSGRAALAAAVTQATTSGSR